MGSVALAKASDPEPKGSPTVRVANVKARYHRIPMVDDYRFNGKRSSPLGQRQQAHHAVFEARSKSKEKRGLGNQANREEPWEIQGNGVVVANGKYRRHPYLSQGPQAPPEQQWTLETPGVAEVSLSQPVTAREKPRRINPVTPCRTKRQGRDVNRNRGRRNPGEEWRPSKATGTPTAAVKQPPTEGPESVTGSARGTALGGLLQKITLNFNNLGVDPSPPCPKG